MMPSVAETFAAALGVHLANITDPKRRCEACRRPADGSDGCDPGGWAVFTAAPVTMLVNGSDPVDLGGEWLFCGRCAPLLASRRCAELADQHLLWLAAIERLPAAPHLREELLVMFRHVAFAAGDGAPFTGAVHRD